MVEVPINLTSRFRQRKINLKQHLRIFKQSNLPDNAEDVRGDLLGVVETGVDKNEEDERHLQAVLSATTSSFQDNTKAKPRDAFIPTPAASKKWSEYKDFYTTGWVETESYIRSSATVEDAQGNTYNIDDVDYDYLQNEINAGVSDPKQQCCEDEFEMICSLFEQVVAEKQPFLATDPTQLMSYKELEPHIVHIIEERRQALKDPLSLEKLLQDSNSVEYAPKFEGSPYRTTHSSLKLFGPSIYKHWRKRKLEAQGKSIFPTLRYETGLSTDESDPYVCFRHREVRQSRKTRRTDQQNIVRIRKLHSEMQSAREILDLVFKRERSRLQQIQSDFEIFELRCRVKSLKRKLRIGPEPDDLELMVSSTKRARQEKQAQLRREAHEREKKARAAQEKQERERERREHQKESSRSAAETTSATQSTTDRKTGVLTSTGSRIPDLDHVTVEQQFLERDMAIQKAITSKLEQRRELDKGWVNVTDTSQLPVVDFFTPINGSNVNGITPPDQHSKHGLRDIDYIGGGCFSNLDYEMDEQGRLQLPLDMLSMGAYDPPELLIQNSKGEISKVTDRVFEQDSTLGYSVPRQSEAQLLCRKRTYGNLEYIDRVYPRHAHPMASFRADLKFNLENGVASESEERLHDRFRFDNDFEDEEERLETLISDPARLNGIDQNTQRLRFSSMLTAKALELIHDAAVQRRKIQQAIQRRQLIQLQQRAQAEAQAQRNAQLQAQTNIRMQQAQRLQRQKRKEEGMSVPAGGNSTGNAGGASAGNASNASNGNASNASGSTSNGTGNASNGNSSTGNSTGNASNGNANGNANASTGNGTGNASGSTSNNASTGNASNGNAHSSLPTNANETFTPQPPKLEAGG